MTSSSSSRAFPTTPVPPPGCGGITGCGGIDEYIQNTDSRFVNGVVRGGNAAARLVVGQRRHNKQAARRRPIACRAVGNVETSYRHLGDLQIYRSLFGRTAEGSGGTARPSHPPGMFCSSSWGPKRVPNRAFLPHSSPSFPAAATRCKNPGPKELDSGRPSLSDSLPNVLGMLFCHPRSSRSSSSPGPLGAIGLHHTYVYLQHLHSVVVS